MLPLENREIAKQLRTPHGPHAMQIGEFMERSNKHMYTMCLKHASLKSKESVLEIGPGNGCFVSEFFRETNDISYTGVELSQEMLQVCKNRNSAFIHDRKASFLKGDIMDLKLPDNSYDVIIAINVIYFLNPVEVYLNDLIRIIKPGGRMVLGFRDISSMQKLPFVDENFSLYDANRLSEILVNSGFEQVDTKFGTEVIKLPDGRQAELLNCSCLALKGKMA